MSAELSASGGPIWFRYRTDVNEDERTILDSIEIKSGSIGVVAVHTNNEDELDWRTLLDDIARIDKPGKIWDAIATCALMGSEPVLLTEEDCVWYAPLRDRLYDFLADYLPPGTTFDILWDGPPDQFPQLFGSNNLSGSWEPRLPSSDPRLEVGIPVIDNQAGPSDFMSGFAPDLATYDENVDFR